MNTNTYSYTTKTFNWSELEAALNTFAKEGWEVFEMYRTERQFDVIFRRPNTITKTNGVEAVESI